jgi:hypothetical protein
MKQSLKELDRLLRGERTRPSALRRGELEIPTTGLSLTISALGALYGVCMGSFALFHKGRSPVYQQVVSSAVKIPTMFLLTVIVTVPSLYVANALIGSRVSIRSMVRLIVASLAVMVAVLASLGPIVAFFSVITTSHPFIVILNVFVFGISALAGLNFMIRTIHRINAAVSRPLGLDPGEDEIPLGDLGDKPESALSLQDPDDFQRLPSHRAVMSVFLLWIVVFALVGTQMSWVLRPFIGKPGEPFIPIAGRGSNFLEGLSQAVGGLGR